MRLVPHLSAYLMLLLLGVVACSKPSAAPPEQALLLRIILSGDEYGTEEERAWCYALEEELEQALENAGAGMLDGDEFGDGRCDVYMYGPDANRMWDVVAPILTTKSFKSGSYATKVFGRIDLENVPEERIDLNARE